MAKTAASIWIIVLILALALFLRIYELGLGISIEQRASVILSLIAGVLSVAGIYLLAKEIFDDKSALISSFIMAVSSKHIFLSRTGTKESFAIFAIIFSLYFIWHGFKYGRIFNFFLAGLFGGATLYAGKGYFLTPLMVLLIFWNYWDYIKKDFNLSKYEQTKHEIIKGFSLLVLVWIATALPIGIYLWQNPEFILSAKTSIFFGSEPFSQFYQNISRAVDGLLLIKFNNSNLLSWLATVFLVIGLIKETTHWLKRKHGHFSVAHTLLFSWLILMIVPALLSSDQFSIYKLIPILPITIILSAKGIWWLIDKLNKWGHISFPGPHKHRANLDIVPFLALLAIITSIAVLEISTVL